MHVVSSPLFSLVYALPSPRLSLPFVFLYLLPLLSFTYLEWTRTVGGSILISSHDTQRRLMVSSLSPTLFLSFLLYSSRLSTLSLSLLSLLHTCSRNKKRRVISINPHIIIQHPAQVDHSFGQVILLWCSFSLFKKKKNKKQILTNKTKE